MSDRAILLRAAAIGLGTLLVLGLMTGTEDLLEYLGPTLLLLWIAGILGSYAMAWSGRGLRRWGWVAVGTLLVMVSAWFLVISAPYARILEGH